MKGESRNREVERTFRTMSDATRSLRIGVVRRNATGPAEKCGYD